MTAQDHIDKIAKALVNLEDAIDKMEDALGEAKKCKNLLHRKLERAQTAYKEQHDPENNVVPFSGGTSKPPPEDPDEPVEP